MWRREATAAELARLGELVGREQHQRLVVGARDLLAQRGFAFRVVLDAFVFGDGEHQFGDAAAEALAQIGRRCGRLLDRVVQDAGGDQLVAAADLLE